MLQKFMFFLSLGKHKFVFWVIVHWLKHSSKDSIQYSIIIFFHPYTKAHIVFLIPLPSFQLNSIMCVFLITEMLF